jgi:hypothetical protein
VGDQFVQGVYPIVAHDFVRAYLLPWWAILFLSVKLGGASSAGSSSSIVMLGCGVVVLGGLFAASKLCKRKVSGKKQ